MKQLNRGEKLYGIKPLPKGLVTLPITTEPICGKTKKSVIEVLGQYFKSIKDELEARKDFTPIQKNNIRKMYIYYWMTGEVIFDDSEEAFSWQLSTPRGSLNTRIKNHVYKTLKVKLPPDIMQKIGAIISSATIATREYSMDVTSNFNWAKGDFGDYGSCFFGGRVGIRKDMENSGFQALRFFVKDYLGTRPGTSRFYKDMAGIGRTWIWKTVIRQTVEHAVIGTDVYVLFNGYGPSTQWQARFLAKYLNLPMKAISLSNQASTTGALWVNDDVGYIIGERKVIHNVNGLDFKMKPTLCEKGGFKDPDDGLPIF